MDAIAGMARQSRKRAGIRVGLDLGKMQDYTAIVVSERQRRPDSERIHHTARMIERMPLGTPYPAIADRVSEIMGNLETLKQSRPDLGDIRLVVDATGVGVAATDLLRERGLKPVAVTITGSDRQTQREDGVLSVGKSYMISRLQVLLQSGRLHLPQTAEATLLTNELKDYELTYTPAGNVTFNARSGQHDDLVLALALAAAVEIPKGPFRPPSGAIGISSVIDDPNKEDPEEPRGMHYKRKVWQ